MHGEVREGGSVEVLLFECIFFICIVLSSCIVWTRIWHGSVHYVFFLGGVIQDMHFCLCGL
jgi:hypothetical protein